MNVLAILPGFIPSTIIGVLRPLAALERLGEIKFRVRHNNIALLLPHDIDWCDVAVFCRNCEINDLYALYELKRKGKKIVYEIDDNFEEIPLVTDVGIYHRYFYRLHVLKRFFSLSDITRVYSERLLQRAVSHGARPQLIRSYFDKSIIGGLQRPVSDGVVRIAYPTGRIDDDELEEKIFSAVRMILLKHDGNVEFHLWRKSMPRQLSGVKGVVLNKGVRGYDNFIRSFFKVGFDIGLAPGIDVPFFHSKTNNKYREFGGCGIAGIYSNFPPYSNSVTHEHSGLLVGSSTEEWASAIERLVLDEKLRKIIVNNAENDVFRNYSFESAVDSWRECFQLLRNTTFVVPEQIYLLLSYKPIFACVRLLTGDHADRPDLRYELLRKALSPLNGAYLEQYSSLTEYLKSPIRRYFAAVIFFISTEREFKIFRLLLPQLNSVIVDMTTYDGDLESAIFDIRAVSIGRQLSILVTASEAKSSAQIAAMPECFFLGDNELFSIEQEFSLTGYPAAFIDLAERHMIFGIRKNRSMYIENIISVVLVTVNRYLRWRGRLTTFFTWIGWRFGFWRS